MPDVSIGSFIEPSRPDMPDAPTLRELGHYEQARQLGQDTLTTMRRILGNDHPHTLRCIHNLAAALANPDKHDQTHRLQE